MTRIFLIMFLLISATVYAQSGSGDKEAYEKGKSLFNEGNYSAAMDALHPVADKLESPYAPYAGYYYSLAAYKKGFLYIATGMASFVNINFPQWKNLDDLRLWMVKFYLEDNNYPKALNTLESISNEEIKKNSESLYLARIDSIKEYNDVLTLYNEYPDNGLIARNLADRIIRKPAVLRNVKLLDTLVTKFNLNRNIYRTNINVEGVKKNQYRVAVLFPFMANNVIPGQSGKSNQFVYDMYEGMKIGNEQLKNSGVNLKIDAYDTKRSGVETQKLIDSGELDQYDMIIGPLYSEPVRLISGYSYSHQIMVFNPLSTNSEITSNNPFAMLFKPSIERQATAAALYADQKLKGNKNYFVFYGNNSRDSINASTFESILNADSFNLNYDHRMVSNDTIDAYKILTNKIKLKDLHLSLKDSLKLLSHYSIDTAAITAAGKKIEDHEIFIMYPDSIGLIYGASSNSLIATSIISGVETRGDNIAVIGNDDWLAIQQLSLDQLKRLNILLTSSGYIDANNPNIEEINNLIIAETHAPPTVNEYLGYEIITYIGHMFKKYGSPFINDLDKEGFYKGVLYYGLDYSSGRDNNLVPILDFIDNNFKIVNDPETKIISSAEKP